MGDSDRISSPEIFESSDTINIGIIIGHSSHPITDNTHQFTHKWGLFVRGQLGVKLEEIIEKVVFNLHESFENPKRILSKPPYQIEEAGYGSFALVVDIYFKTKEVKKQSFDYDLVLHSSPNFSQQNHWLVLPKNLSEEFNKKLKLCLKDKDKVKKESSSTGIKGSPANSLKESKKSHKSSSQKPSHSSSKTSSHLKKEEESSKLKRKVPDSISEESRPKKHRSESVSSISSNHSLEEGIKTKAAKKSHEIKDYKKEHKSSKHSKKDKEKKKEKLPPPKEIKGSSTPLTQEGKRGLAAMFAEMEQDTKGHKSLVTFSEDSTNGDDLSDMEIDVEKVKEVPKPFLSAKPETKPAKIPEITSSKSDVKKEHKKKHKSTPDTSKSKEKKKEEESKSSKKLKFSTPQQNKSPMETPKSKTKEVSKSKEESSSKKSHSDKSKKSSSSSSDSKSTPHKKDKKLKGEEKPSHSTSTKHSSSSSSSTKDASKISSEESLPPKKSHKSKSEHSSSSKDSSKHKKEKSNHHKSSSSSSSSKVKTEIKESVLESSFHSTPTSTQKNSSREENSSSKTTKSDLKKKKHEPPETKPIISSKKILTYDTNPIIKIEPCATIPPVSSTKKNVEVARKKMSGTFSESDSSLSSNEDDEEEFVPLVPTMISPLSSPKVDKFTTEEYNELKTLLHSLNNGGLTNDERKQTIMFKVVDFMTQQQSYQLNDVMLEFDLENFSTNQLRTIKSFF